MGVVDVGFGNIRFLLDGGSERGRGMDRLEL